MTMHERVREPQVERSGPAHVPRTPRPVLAVGRGMSAQRALLAMQASCGNRAVQRYVGERGFISPAPPNFTTGRNDLSRDYETTKGEDIANPAVANMSAAIVVYRRQPSSGAPASIQSEQTRLRISGNPRLKTDHEKRLYPSKGRVLSKRDKSRIDCAEPKTISDVRAILDELSVQPGVDARPVVHFYSEHLPCQYCRPALNNLAAAVPWVDIIVYWKTWFVADHAMAPATWTGAPQNGGWYWFQFSHTEVRSPRPWPKQRQPAESKGAVPLWTDLLSKMDPDKTESGQGSSTTGSASTSTTNPAVNTAKATATVSAVKTELTRRPEAARKLAATNAPPVVTQQAGEYRVDLRTLRNLVLVTGSLIVIALILRGMGLLPFL